MSASDEHVHLPDAAPNGGDASKSRKSPRSSAGWDGKLRIDRRPVITNPEVLSDPEYSDEDAPPREQIEADEGADDVRLLGRV